MKRGLAYIGLVSEVHSIDGADKVESATVVCGTGGKWMGVVPKGQFMPGHRCVIYLPDAIVPQTEEFAFMERHKWRVSMRRFLGVPSEVLIMPDGISGNVGDDVTDLLGVEKYEKPIPANMAGDIYGSFPYGIPITDEPNFQGVPEIVNALRGLPYVATLKADGTSCTAYKKDGHFGVCSRNWELKPGNNIYWRVAEEYRVADILKDGWAIQFEVVGPGVQKNPMGLSKLEPRAFSLYDIDARCYASDHQLRVLCGINNMPVAEIIQEGDSFDLSDEEMRKLAEVTYPTGKPGEGIVIRSLDELVIDGKRLSFKVINLLYK